MTAKPRRIRERRACVERTKADNKSHPRANAPCTTESHGTAVAVKGMARRAETTAVWRKRPFRKPILCPSDPRPHERVIASVPRGRQTGNPARPLSRRMRASATTPSICSFRTNSERPAGEVPAPASTGRSESPDDDVADAPSSSKAVAPDLTADAPAHVGTRKWRGVRLTPPHFGLTGRAQQGLRREPDACW